MRTRRGAGPLRSRGRSEGGLVAFVVGCVVATALLAGCGGDSSTSSDGSSTGAPSVRSGEVELVTARVDDLAAAVDRWQAAETVGVAHAAAEEARNLITGPDTLGSGDLDGDGEARGLEDRGLLPAEDGTPGVFSPLEGCTDVERDVLGGSWDDAAERWAVLDAAIDAWTPTNNTFPSLPSHPQRVVGWATLTLDSSSLDEALEYAGHAQLHVSVTETALASCD